MRKAFATPSAAWAEENAAFGDNRREPWKPFLLSASQPQPLFFAQDFRKQINPILYYTAMNFQTFFEERQRFRKCASRAGSSVLDRLHQLLPALQVFGGSPIEPEFDADNVSPVYVSYEAILGEPELLQTDVD